MQLSGPVNFHSLFCAGANAQLAASVLAAAFLSSSATVARAELKIEDLLVDPVQELGESCSNVAVEERFRRWQDRDATPNAFQSVAETLNDVTPPEFEAAVENGCNRNFFAFFMACTQYDDPKALNIVPSGINATTEAELSTLVAVCLRAADLANILPVQDN